MDKIDVSGPSAGTDVIEIEGIPVFGGAARDGMLLGHVIPAPWASDREVTITIRPLTIAEKTKTPGAVFYVGWETSLSDGMRLAGCVHSTAEGVMRDLGAIGVQARETIAAYEREHDDG